MNRREREALDRHITGNYGEDQFSDTTPYPTPRTDRESYDAIKNTNAALFANIAHQVVQADFARDLERDLAEAVEIITKALNFHTYWHSHARAFVQRMKQAGEDK